MSQDANLGDLFQSAQDDGVITPVSAQLLNIQDIGAQIQAGLGVKVGDVNSSSSVLVSMLIDDSASIGFVKGNAEAVIAGYNSALHALKDSKQRDSVLVHSRALSGQIYTPYCELVDLDGNLSVPELALGDRFRPPVQGSNPWDATKGKIRKGKNMDTLLWFIIGVVVLLVGTAGYFTWKENKRKDEEFEEIYNSHLIFPVNAGPTTPSGQVSEIDDPMLQVGPPGDDLSGIVSILMAETILNQDSGNMGTTTEAVLDEPSSVPSPADWTQSPVSAEPSAPPEEPVDLKPDTSSVWSHHEDTPDPTPEPEPASSSSSSSSEPDYTPSSDYSGGSGGSYDTGGSSDSGGSDGGDGGD